MDPLSDVLSLLKLRSFKSGGFEAGGNWSIYFPKHSGVKCYTAVSGECWLAVDGVDEEVRVRSGDCFLLPTGAPFRLASDMSLPPVDATTVFPVVQDGGVSRLNDGGDFFSVGGHFALSGDFADVLTSSLPPIVHLQNEADKAALRWSVEGMRQELRNPQPGGFLIAQQLATMMLVLALRLHLKDGTKEGTGWLFALADKRMATALKAMHADPAHRWTLQSLAETACMSRTAFATRFKQTVGMAPLDYLTRWRMLLAAEKLKNSAVPVSSIAQSLGYESDSAFSTAFKRVMGRSPRSYAGV